MKAARIHGYNAAPIVEEVTMPTPGPDEVLIRVAAASLNPLDVKMQKGDMHAYFPVDFPYTLGTDLSGTAEQVGQAVSDWQPGDQVIARTDPTRGGALAEFVAVPATSLVKAPTSVPLADAAGLPTVGGTAWQALFEAAELKAGQTVLIHAGAGGVGSFAVQYAHRVGAHVIATASGTGLEMVRRLGADQVIDYRAQDFTQQVSDIDVVLDTIGDDTQRRSFDVLRPGGLLLSTTAPPDEGLARAHNVRSTFMFHSSDAHRLQQVVESVNAGTTILIDRTVPLSSLNDAFEYQASGRARGKIIVIPG